MLTVVYFIVTLLTIGSVTSEEASFKGCFSTSFVQQYAYYYKIKQALPLKQSFAACNNRLTKYIGLQVDKSNSNDNVVYCGNDLLEMSQEEVSSKCQACQQNSNMFCGENGFIAVYQLRDDTPMALLIMTDDGVEMLIDNKTNRLVSNENHSPYKYLDYIYTEDTIISTVHSQVLRSYYVPLAMKYTESLIINTKIYDSFYIALDYTKSTAYYGYYGDNGLYKLSLGDSQSESFSAQSSIPQDLSIDPYNRSLIFLSYHENVFFTFLLDEEKFFRHTLEFYKVEKISALTLDHHDRLIYAIVKVKGQGATSLVRLDYSLYNFKVLYMGFELDGATTIEVFNRNVVWLTKAGDKSIIYMCTLASTCMHRNPDVLYKGNRKVYDFSIYHPDKQTPGKSSLCAKMSCVHGCERFSLFTAICSCPSGIERDSNNNVCKDYTSSTNVHDAPNALRKAATRTIDKVHEQSNRGFIVFMVICAFAILAAAALGFVYKEKIQAYFVADQRFEMNEPCNDYEVLFKN